MNRKVQWVVLLAVFAAGVMFFAVQPAEAGWRHTGSWYASYESGDGYNDYPAVGSNVDRYDHAAAASWGFRYEASDSQTPPQIYYRGQSPRWGYRR